MKIAIVNQPLDTVLPPDQNSLGIWTYEAAPLLAKLPDTEVVVYAKRIRGRPERATSTRDGVTYRLVQTGPQRAWDRLAGALRRWMRDPRDPAYARWWYQGLFTLQVAIDIRRRRCDAVHIHNWTGLVPLIRRLNPHAVIALHMNCDWISQLDRKRMGKRVAMVDLVLGVSPHVADEVRRVFPAAAAKCKTLPNGVDPSRFVPDETPADRPPTLVFVGRVSPEKGVHDLLAAMPLVVAEVGPVRVEIVGPVGALPAELIVHVSDDPGVIGLSSFYDREYGEQLREIVAREGLEDLVSFVGPLPHDEVVAHVQRGDILVNPSYSESFGMSLVEAMACSRPVVATRVGGMKSIVDDGRTGLIVDRGDVAGLAAAIVRLVGDDDLRATMGRNGRKRVEERFSWDVIAASARDLYGSAGKRR
jgi:glycosyltransferase involved in cell wall biosynthesis